MANYYTAASFIVPCTEEQAQLAVEALGEIDGDTTPYALEVIKGDDSKEYSPKEQIIRYCFAEHPEQDKDDPDYEKNWELSAEVASRGVWIHHDESINTEHAAIFTQAILQAFDLPELVQIDAAHTCSKHRLDAFGGHCCVVTKDFIRWDNMHYFLEAERAAHANKERYSLCEITQVNGEVEYGTRFLMKYSSSIEPMYALEHYLMQLDEGMRKEENGYCYPDGRYIKNTEVTVLDPYDFAVMRQYLPVHTASITE